MKSYLEIQVPLRYDAHWLEVLRTALHQVNVRWQMGYYHITMAFLDDTPQDINLCPILEKHLNRLNAPTLSFDKLDAFATRSGTYIIYLTASDIPQNFISVIESIRKELKETGCRIDSDFRLHVTLGRAFDSKIELSKLQEIIGTVSIPSISLTLTDVDYRVFRGKTIYEKKLID